MVWKWKVLTSRKSKPSEHRTSGGNLISKGSRTSGFGILRPEKNSLILKSCMWRGIKSPKVLRIKKSWSKSDLPGQSGSPCLKNKNICQYWNQVINWNLNYSFCSLLKKLDYSMLIITNTNYSNFCKKNNHDLNHDDDIVLIEFDKNKDNNNSC